MKTIAAPSDYAGHRFPPAILAHAVWRSFRFARRFRDVEESLAERGVIVTDESVRRWCGTFGQGDTNALRRRRPRPGDTWHPDAVFIRINGRTHSLWRAVDQGGAGLDILVQPRRDKRAAVTFLRTRRKGLPYVPRVLITDTLASDGAAKHEVLPRVEHRPHKRLNNRAEHAQQPTRERERRRMMATISTHSSRRCQRLSVRFRSNACRSPPSHAPSSLASLSMLNFHA